MNNSSAPSVSGDIPTTQWTTILAVIQDAAGQPSEAARQALERFCQQYYGTVKQFFLHQRCAEVEAQDFTQEFFARKIFSSYEDGKGFLFNVERKAGQPFRGYLFTVLWNFYMDQRRIPVRDGGGAIHEPIGDKEISAPENAQRWSFDRMFALELIKKVLDDSSDSRVLLAYFLNTSVSREQARAEAAQQLGMSSDTFKVALHRFHRKLGKLLWQEVSHYAGPEEQDIKNEILHLLARVTEPAP